MQPLLKFLQWEEDVTSTLEADMQVCRSDAQGIVEAQRLLMCQAWQNHMTARQTADQIIQLKLTEDTQHD